MKILITVPAFYPFSHGGGQAYVLHIARELAGRGHGVSVVSDGPWEGKSGSPPREGFRLRRYRYAGVGVTSVQVDPGRVQLGDQYTGEGGGITAALAAAIDEEHPDLVHGNGFKAAATRLCREKGVPLVVTAHHPGIVCPAGTLLTDQGAMCTHPAGDDVCIRCCSRQKTGSSWTGSALASLPRSFAHLLGRRVAARATASRVARGLSYPWFVHLALKSKRFVLDGAPCLIAPSRALARYLTLNGVPSGRVRILGHGIAPVPPRTAGRPPGGAVRFGFLGSFSPSKGFHLLVKALKRIPVDLPCEVHVFAEARHPWERRYREESLAGSRADRRLVFHPTVSQDALVEAYGTIDVLVVPSIFLEVFGLVVLEAHSAGLPVIASRCGGPEELIRDGIDGILVDRDDPESLTDAMKSLILEPDRIAALAAALGPVRTVREHVDGLLDIYREVARLRSAAG